MKIGQPQQPPNDLLHDLAGAGADSLHVRIGLQVTQGFILKIHSIFSSV
jgi:hypothetical protein